MEGQIAITGGSGFIGGAVVRAAAEAGLRATALGRKPVNCPAGIAWADCDLLDEASIARALPSVSRVLHLASRVQVGDSIREPAVPLRENPAMLINVLETLRKRGEKPLVVFASTDRQYARNEGDVDESAPTFPVEPYTASKMACETILRAYQHACGIPFVILRIDSVYGPGQPEAMFISDAIKTMLSGRTVTVGTPDVEKNFVFVEDVADAFLRAARSDESAWNRVYNIGGERVSLPRVAELLQKAVKDATAREVEVRYNPSVGRDARYEVRPFTLKTGAAEKALGWKARTPLDRGLRKTVDFFLAAHAKKPS